MAQTLAVKGALWLIVVKLKDASKSSALKEALKKLDFKKCQMKSVTAEEAKVILAVQVEKETSEIEADLTEKVLKAAGGKDCVEKIKVKKNTFRGLEDTDDDDTKESLIRQEIIRHYAAFGLKPGFVKCLLGQISKHGLHSKGVPLGIANMYAVLSDKVMSKSRGVGTKSCEKAFATGAKTWKFVATRSYGANSSAWSSGDSTWLTSLESTITTVLADWSTKLKAAHPQQSDVITWTKVTNDTTAVDLYFIVHKFSAFGGFGANMLAGKDTKVDGDICGMLDEDGGGWYPSTSPKTGPKILKADIGTKAAVYIDGSDSASNVVRQAADIAQFCIAHEIGHVYGLSHEFQRSDQAFSYAGGSAVYKTNDPSDVNYGKISSKYYISDALDYNSVMWYEPCDVWTNPNGYTPVGATKLAQVTAFASTHKSVTTNDAKVALKLLNPTLTIAGVSYIA